MTPLDTTTEISLHGWPLFLFLGVIFIANVLISRMITAKLVKEKFIKKNSPEMRKAFMFWFCPILGAAGLLMLLYTHRFIKFWKPFSKWFFLKTA